MPFRLQLDYDGMTKEEVEENAKYLVATYPQLKLRYRIEPSETPTCWYVIFPLSAFTTFEEAYNVAFDSKCDKDWLGFCKTYKSFGLRTKGITKVRRESVVAGERPEPKNKPKQILTSPVLVDFKPDNYVEVKRLVQLCASIDDQEWEYRIEYPLAEPLTHVVVGCKDLSQAQRRINWVKYLGIRATAKIIEKEAKKP